MDLYREGVGLMLIDEWSELVLQLNDTKSHKGSSADVLKRKVPSNPDLGESLVGSSSLTKFMTLQEGDTPNREWE
jgi:hypothetical protein